MNDIEALHGCEIFAGSDDGEITRMLGCLGAAAREYDRDEYIFSPGETPVRIGIVLTGIVRMVRDDWQGARTIIAETGAGGVFGENCCFAGGGRLSVGYVAAAPTRVMFIDSTRIYTPCSRVCACHRQMTEKMLSIVARRNVELTLKNELLSCRTTREKLLTYLSSQATGSGSFTIPFDRQELADYLAVDRSAMSSALSRLRREGIISYDKNSFRIRRQSCTGETGEM